MTVELAHTLRALGLSIIPLKPRSKEPDTDALPVGSWKPYQRQPPTSEDIVRWFGNGAERNAGIVTGRVSEVVVIESDTTEAESWCATHLPKTPMMTRSARGVHRYYRHPGVDGIPAFLEPGGGLKIEVKRDGQYVVAPGSVHPSGHVYTVVEKWPDALEAVPMLPQRVGAGSGEFDDGQRNNALTKMAGRLRRQGYSLDEIEALLLVANQTRCRPPIKDEGEVRKIARSVARYDAGELAEPASRLVELSSVVPEDVSWLWHPYIPLGKVTLIEGDPGLGKSWLSCALATAISLGKGLPQTGPRDPGSVLLLSAEDGLGDTIRPRLDAMEADVSRISAVDGPVVFNDDGLLEIEAHVSQTKPSLIVVDPFVAYLGGKVDLHKANETRAVLKKLAALAERHRLALVLIRHLTKGGRDKSIYRGIGSIDITAACRSVLLVGADGQDPTRRGVVHIKSNLAPMGDSLGYAIEEGRFTWTGASDLTAQQILSSDTNGNQASAKDEAITFLKQVLEHGPMASADIDKQARALGITPITLKRAKKEIGIISTPIRDKHGKMVGWNIALRTQPSVPSDEELPF